MGTAYLYSPNQQHFPDFCGDVQQEQKQFDNARETARQQLQELFEKTQRELVKKKAMILDVQMMMADDLDYLEEVQSRIQQGCSAARARF